MSVWGVAAAVMLGLPLATIAVLCILAVLEAVLVLVDWLRE